MFSRNPYSRTPFSGSISSGYVRYSTENLTILLDEVVASIDKSIAVVDNIDIIIISTTKIDLSVNDSLTLSALHEATLDTQIVPYDSIQLEIITSYLKEMPLFDDITIQIIEAPIEQDVSNLLTDVITLDIDGQVHYLFKEKDVVKIIKGNINDLTTLSGSIDNLIQLRGDYKLPQINQNIEMWAGEAINIHIHTSLPTTIYDIRWRVLETPEDNESVIPEKSLLGTGLQIINDKIVIDLQFEDTKDLGGNRYLHEVRVWSGDIGDKPNTIATGRIKINPSTFVDVV